jgi:recombination protein RecR
MLCPCTDLNMFSKNQIPETLSKLISSLKRIPGVGEKTAMRYAFFLMRDEKQQLMIFRETIGDLIEKLKTCRECMNIADSELCPICSDNSRDSHTVCVVEDIPDMVAIEGCGEYRGVYHILGGVLAPLKGITPDRIYIEELKNRISRGGISEVIIATNTRVEGETTALYIKNVLKDMPVKITRIASGIPAGGELEYIDSLTLSYALKGRREI